MIYAEYMNKACDEVLTQAENGLWYLEPSYRIMLDLADLQPEKVTDYEINWDAVKEYLELTVKARNTVNDTRPAVTDWLHQLITTTVEPAMLQEETDYIKQVVEFMKANHEGETVK